MKIREKVTFKRSVFIVLIFTFGLIFHFILTSPKEIQTASILALDGDLLKGKRIFYAAGCGSCHVGSDKSEKLLLAGGTQFETQFGTFYAPNVSMSKEYGIGRWSSEDFYRAIKLGQNPEGKHYYPVFPYTSYSKMSDQDIMNLWRFWKTLPVSDEPSKEHKLFLPFNMRSNVGVWKSLFMKEEFVGDKENPSTYLVEALAHCSECHTPRNMFGAMKTKQWMRGASNPSGKGKIPSIHPDDLKWTKEEIAEYLSSGLTPNYDVAGGNMALVVANLSKLKNEDLLLIASYIKNVK